MKCHRCNGKSVKRLSNRRRKNKKYQCVNCKVIFEKRDNNIKDCVIDDY